MKNQKSKNSVYQKKKEQKLIIKNKIKHNKNEIKHNKNETTLRIKKKKGRKPKEKVYGYVSHMNTDIFQSNREENIILHLSLSNNLNNFNISSYSDQTEEYTQENFLTTSVIGQNYEPSPIDQQNNIFTNNFNIHSYQEINNTTLTKKESNKRVIYTDIKKNILAPFQQYNKKKIWPEKTSIYCFWCCHPFNTPPCGLPIKYTDKTFYVVGCFCSPECCAAYNFNTKHDTEEIWERFNLLHLLYSDIYNIDEIQLAPPQSTLKIFGGPLSIEEFRSYSRDTKKYKLVYPPMIAVIPQVDDEPWNCQLNNEKPSYVPLDIKKVEQAKVNLRLKRGKPITNKSNTLENCMKLKYNYD